MVGNYGNLNAVENVRSRKQKIGGYQQLNITDGGGLAPS